MKPTNEARPTTVYSLRSKEKIGKNYCFGSNLIIAVTNVTPSLCIPILHFISLYSENKSVKSLYLETLLTDWRSS